MEKKLQLDELNQSGQLGQNVFDNFESSTQPLLFVGLGQVEVSYQPTLITVISLPVSLFAFNFLTIAILY